MTRKIFSVTSAAVLLSTAALSVVSAEGTGSVNANIKAQARVELNAQDRGSEQEDRDNATSAAAKAEERGNATSASRERGDDATSTETGEDGQLTAESHRSSVATFVRSLLKVADRERGIGAQVRVIAKAQSDSASTSAEAITKVQKRSALQTFFLGNDYKNLGTLRSEIATTTNNVAQLKDLLAKATSAADKAELSAQIQVLEDSQAKMQAFVNAQENVFNLFGWFAKLFLK